MAMTLNVNQFLTGITNLIVNTRMLDTLSDNVRPIVKCFLKEYSPFGDQDRYLAADILEDGNYEENSTLLTVKKPKTNEETVALEDKKKWKISLTQYLLQGAFTDEYSLSNFYNLLISMLTKTKNVFLYQKSIKALQNWTPTISTQTITIKKEANDTDETLSKKIYLTLKEIYINMLAPSRLYNDIQYMEDTMIDDLNFFVNSKFENMLEVSTNAFAFNLSELNKWIGNNKFLIPTEQFTNEEDKTKTIGWVWHKDKYVIKPFFDLSTSFFDADNLIQHQYIHSWFKSGYVKAVMGVKIVLSE